MLQHCITVLESTSWMELRVHALISVAICKAVDNGDDNAIVIMTTRTPNESGNSHTLIDRILSWSTDSPSLEFIILILIRELIKDRIIADLDTLGVYEDAMLWRTGEVPLLLDAAVVLSRRLVELDTDPRDTFASVSASSRSSAGRDLGHGTDEAHSATTMVGIWQQAAAAPNGDVSLGDGAARALDLLLRLRGCSRIESAQTLGLLPGEDGVGTLLVFGHGHLILRNRGDVGKIGSGAGGSRVDDLCSRRARTGAPWLARSSPFCLSPIHCLFFPSF